MPFFPSQEVDYRHEPSVSILLSLSKPSLELDCCVCAEPLKWSDSNVLEKKYGKLDFVGNQEVPIREQTQREISNVNNNRLSLT